jgi:fibronectin type 3 domain-containing protein
MKKAILIFSFFLLSTLFVYTQTAQVVRRPRSMAITGGSVHQVSLTWNNTTPGVTFNVYRGTSQGGESLYATGQSATSYVDTNVVGGSSYWYYVTCVLNGDESAGSNEVSANVPNNPPPPSGLTVTSVK